jgi:hypothetical protein
MAAATTAAAITRDLTTILMRNGRSVERPFRFGRPGLVRYRVIHQ